MDAVLISLAAVLILIAYTESATAPFKRSSAIAKFVGMHFAKDETVGSAIIAADMEAVAQRRAEFQRSISITSAGSIIRIVPVHPAFAVGEPKLDGFQRQAIAELETSKRNGVAEQVMVDGVGFVRVVSPLYVPHDCAGCVSNPGARLSKGELAALVEVFVPLSVNQPRYAKKLMYAMGMLAAALMSVLGILFPLLRQQSSQKDDLSKRAESLEIEATTDALTKLYNRRYFEIALQDYLDEFNYAQMPLGLLVMDIDHFKSVNDTYGHDVGDMVLREVAGRLLQITREHDVVARVGGEEFAVITPYARAEQIIPVAERFRKMVESLRIEVGNVVLRPTISIGIATNAQGISDSKQFFKLADIKLYEAKRMGRNRVAA